jgi:GT2 family glycosyltransferase
MIKQKDIYIIIVTYNGMKWLARCLESTKPYPVIVVDNNSTDGTVDYMKNNHPEIILFEEKENLGFGQANNVGISYALNEGADFVFLLNQDAYLEPGCLESLVKAQDANLEYGILSPVHLNGEGNRLDKNFSNYLNYQANPDFYSDYVLNKPKKLIYDIPFVNAAGWLLSKKCLFEVGGFDPIFFHYGEDVNLCQRILYHDFKIGILPGNYLRHDREFRYDEKIKPFTKNYWENISRSHKIKYADVNLNNTRDLENSLSNRKTALFKSRLKFDSRAVNIYRQEIEMLENNISKIKASLKINRDPGSHYLDNIKL